MSARWRFELPQLSLNVYRNRVTTHSTNACNSHCWKWSRNSLTVCLITTPSSLLRLNVHHSACGRQLLLHYRLLTHQQQQPRSPLRAPCNRRALFSRLAPGHGPSEENHIAGDDFPNNRRTNQLSFNYVRPCRYLCL